MTVEKTDENVLVWDSIDENGASWFKSHIELGTHLSTVKTSDKELSNTLLKIFQASKMLNPSFLENSEGLKITTNLDFPRNWGLGTSSTLINNIANWAQVDAHQLLAETFGGSGYDIACAQHNAPILYQLVHSKPTVEEIAFHPPFKDCLYFVYLNKKQNSREAIANYRNNVSDLSQEKSEISDITKKIGGCTDLIEFRALIDTHEGIISKIIHQKPIKERLFPDFDGSIKSLGAWGGDFILVTSKNNPANYFKEKGLEIVIPFENMVL